MRVRNVFQLSNWRYFPPCVDSLFWECAPILFADQTSTEFLLTNTFSIFHPGTDDDVDDDDADDEGEEDDDVDSGSRRCVLFLLCSITCPVFWTSVSTQRAPLQAVTHTSDYFSSFRKRKKNAGTVKEKRNIKTTSVSFLLQWNTKHRKRDNWHTFSKLTWKSYRFYSKVSN